jgi:hypothetical protein
VSDNSAIVKGLYDAAARGDMNGFFDGLHPNVEWREAEGSPYAETRPFVGPQAVGGVLGRIATDIDQFAVVPQSFVEGGDTVVVEGRYQGKVHRTGKPLDAQFAHIWNLRNGKVVRFQQYTDTKQWAEAL